MHARPISAPVVVMVVMPRRAEPCAAPSLALLIVQAYSRTMAAFGVDDPDTHIAATNLAISLSRMGRHAEAGNR